MTSKSDRPTEDLSCLKVRYAVTRLAGGSWRVWDTHEERYVYFTSTMWDAGSKARELNASEESK